MLQLDPLKFRSNCSQERARAHTHTHTHFHNQKTEQHLASYLCNRRARLQANLVSSCRRLSMLSTGRAPCSSTCTRAARSHQVRTSGVWGAPWHEAGTTNQHAACTHEPLDMALAMGRLAGMNPVLRANILHQVNYVAPERGHVGGWPAFVREKTGACGGPPTCDRLEPLLQ